jgi:SET domain-containing protein
LNCTYNNPLEIKKKFEITNKYNDVHHLQDTLLIKLEEIAELELKKLKA